MWKRSMRAMFAGALTLTLLLLGAAPALAHEGRKVGDLEIEVGWGAEPVLAGQLNSALILLVHDGEPVIDLGDTLTFEVTFGDQTQQFPIEPFFEPGEFGTPGDYRAWFIPTRPGQYTFHYFGTIDGEDFDETFTPGPGGFEEVESPQPLQFPEQEPSTGELAARIEREVPRLTGLVEDVQAAANAAADDASSAKTLGLIGLIVGAIGLIVAIGALVASRRRKA
ncbi:MAG TPA: hypothetical protein VJZ98_09695 [Actinomycetota bacterium]|nr:hypothetical protein [Actinomycetota bacterium]